MAKKPKRYAIGIDVGGTKILAAIIDDKHQVLGEIKTKTKPEKGIHHFLKDLDDAVRFVVKESGVDRKDVVGIGVGSPGFIHEAKGIVLGSPNIPFLKGFPLADRLTARTKFPVVLGNDVQTGLYGEHQMGAAKGYANVVGLFMGTGVGGAIIVNHQLYRGFTGTAGEIGHVQMDPQGPLCGCGRRGCFEAFAGRLAIASDAALLVARQRAPHLAEEAGTDLRAMKSGSLARSIQKGDRAIEDLIRAKARLVGAMMANVTALLNPELIVLGGGVVEAMPALIAREAEREMRAQAIGPAGRFVKVAVSKLGDHAIVLGAAKRAFDRFGAAQEKARPS